MAKFLVERHLPGITPEQLQAAATAARDNAAQLTKEGTDVTYLRSTFIPSEERCFCLFEGVDERAVIEANRRANLPFERVVEAMHLAKEDL